MAVVCIGLIAFMALSGSFNTTYGSSIATNYTNKINPTLASLNSSLASISTSVGASVTNHTGGSSLDSITAGFKAGWATISSIPTLMGLTKSVMADTAITLGAGQYYTIAAAVFIFTFCLLFAYILILGTKRIL